MIKAIIVDDEPHAIELLSGYLAKVPGIELVFSSTNSIEAFQYIQKSPVDLIYLDIHMPELNGLQFMKLLAGKSKVILTTAYPQYALEGYEHDIIDYLLKPILFERFLKATQKSINALTAAAKPETESKTEHDNEQYIFVKSDVRNKLVKVKLADIKYVEAKGNYICFHLAQGQVMTLATVKEIEERLMTAGYLRIHKSFIIPLDKIDAVEGNTVLIGKDTIPVGNAYKETLHEHLKGKVFLNKKG